MQEYNKASLSRAAAACPSYPSVPTSLSLASSLTTADIEVVVQQVLSHTSTALSVTSGKQPWFFDTARCNHMTQQSLLLVYPLMTLFIFQNYPSICFLLVNFVN